MKASKSWQLHSIFAFVSLSQAAFFYPTPQASLIEHILVDTHGAHSSGFADAITPCTNYVSGNQSMGRETAAQWLRVAFHDAITARVDEGLGGVDASIGFETLRDENSGSAFNDSFAFWRPYVNAKVSMADLVALSVSVSVGNCGGPQIPFRGGRIDATEGGAFGVPAPDTSLDETLQYFANAGFDQVDSIGLTACGHTLGSVHHGGFPTVVGPQAVTNSNLAGGIHFDSTVAVFDIDVVNEYLNNTGNQGGPLVTSFNVSSRSDLRLYESDNNATMIKLAEEGTGGFFDTCVTLLRRLVETVPSDVVLSDVIQPLSIKPINASLDFDATGNLVFSGYIRTLSSTASTAPASLTLKTSSTSQSLTLTPESALGTNVFGSTSFFPFTTTISNPSSFSTFTVTDHGYSKSFPVQTQAFIVPSMTSVVSTNATTIVEFTIAACNRSSAPSVEIRVPVAQMGTLGPAIRTFDNITVVSDGSKPGYNLWSGSVDVGTGRTGSIMIAIVEGEEEIDVLFP